jgi:type IV secretion system protein VirB6
MKLIRFLILLVLFSGAKVVFASASEDDADDWRNASWDSLTNHISGCLEVPSFIDVTQGSYSLSLEDSGKWVATGNYVYKNKSLQFEWFTASVQPRPDKYKVLYRVDPRFSKPQVFIQSYDYDQDKYISDFHQYKSGKFLDYQDDPEMSFKNRIGDFDDYFKFNNRDKIPVKKDDVINITVGSASNYFSSNSEMNSELGLGRDELTLIYTEVSIPDNRVIYASSTRWCADVMSKSGSDYGKYCQTPTMYLDTKFNWETYEGKINNATFDNNKASLQSCADGANGQDNNPVCYYDKGRGLTFAIGGTVIKKDKESFVSSSTSGKDFFYYKSDVNGDLDIYSDWKINNMYILNQYMKSWDFYTTTNFGGSSQDYSTFTKTIKNYKNAYYMEFLHFGRYFLDIEIGNSEEVVPQTDLDQIRVEYIINDGSIPSDSTEGTPVDKYFRTNAPDTGYLWIRVVRPNNKMTGNVQVKTTNYTGTTWFSDVIYNDLVSPLRTKFNQLSKTLYIALVSNTAFENIAKTMLVLYIMVYGLMFLAGATQITVYDMVMRVLKIAVILALLGKDSWTFFNDNLFEFFVDGTDYLLGTVIGVTSDVENIFGFIDPVFDKYTNPSIWFLLLIQLVHVHTGLTFFALITMYALLLYLSALLEVIVGYCLAFLGLAVMISLAPLFIILILFERTKSIFDNWLSTIFSYMVQPTILLIFFLLIDQIMNDQVLRSVVSSCWEIIIPIKLHLNLGHIGGVPLSFNFSLPFLQGIPFYVPRVESINSIDDFLLKDGTFIRIATSSLLVFTLSKLSKGLVEYVTLLVQHLTNVLAARQEGALQKTSSPIGDISNDINNINPLAGAASFAKSKFIDQKLDIPKEENKDQDIDYSKVRSREKIRSSEQNKGTNGD